MERTAGEDRKAVDEPVLLFLGVIVSRHIRVIKEQVGVARASRWMVRVRSGFESPRHRLSCSYKNPLPEDHSGILCLCTGLLWSCLRPCLY